MSADALPITPARFAAAIADLSLSSLHLKVLELRNSIAHLDYSNEQLRPFAEGINNNNNNNNNNNSLPTDAVAESDGAGQEQRRTPPDPDCVDAIRENEAVIERMQERIRLVRAEVEARGFSWTEFQSKEEADAAAAAAAVAEELRARNGVNGVDGVNGHVGGDANDADGAGAGADNEMEERLASRHAAWSDGTFSTGVIGSNGTVRMDAVAGGSRPNGTAGGGSLSDDELRRRVEAQMRDLGVDEDDEEGGLYL